MHNAEYAAESKEDATMGHPANRLAVPAQRPPVYRNPLEAQGHQNFFGAEAAQTGCSDLTGLARQYCYDRL